MNEFEEFFTRLWILSENAEHGTRDCLALQLLNSPHHHTHVTVKDNSKKATTCYHGARIRSSCHSMSFINKTKCFSSKFCLSPPTSTVYFISFHCCRWVPLRLNYCSVFWSSRNILEQNIRTNWFRQLGLSSLSGPLWSINRIPAAAGVMVGMSSLLGGR